MAPGAHRRRPTMSRQAAHARSGSDRTSLYDEITTKVITELEVSVVR